MFEPFVWKYLHRDKVKLRGSLRTKRLRKKRYKHFNELYPKYRDELFMERHGMTFMEWRLNSFLKQMRKISILEVRPKENGKCRAYKRDKQGNVVRCGRISVVIVTHPHNPEVFCAECYDLLKNLELQSK